MKINKIYSNEIKNIKNFYEKNNFVQLENFFLKIPTLKNFKLKKKINLTSHIFYECKIKKNFFNKDFFLFIEKIIGKKKIKKIILKKFQKNNYTILNDDFLDKNKIEIILDFTKNFNKKNGGQKIYLNKKKEVFYLDGKFNCLTIINKKNLISYTKYLNINYKKNFILRFELSL